MFSGRVPSELSSNRFTRAVERARAAGRPLVDLTISNPTQAGFEYPPDLLRALADPRALVYEPTPFGLDTARRAVAADFGRRGIAVSADRIVLTASTSDGYAMVFKLLADAGDDVLVPRPSYPLFDHLTRLDAVTAVPYDLEFTDRWRIDLASVEQAVTSRTRAVLLVSPNNPTGSFVQRDELDRIASVCAARSIAIVVDEVFADYEIEPGAAARAGQPLESAAPLVFSLGGLSKSVGLPQVKLGWIAIGGSAPSVAAALERLELVLDTYLSVSTPVQIAAAELLERGAIVRRHIQRRIAANYRALVDRVRAAPACRVLASEGGWYGVLQVPSFGPEESLVVELVERDNVIAHPGYFFDFPRESYLVVSLLAPEPAFADGIERVLRHFDCSVGAGVDHD